MVMIVRNERDQIQPCLESFADHVDEVVVCDMGSRDGTVAEVRRVAQECGWAGKLVLGRCTHDDFAAARAYAHGLASGEWHAWCDAGERVLGASRLRGRVLKLPDSIVLHARSEVGNALFWRPRVFRPAAGRWRFRAREEWCRHERSSLSDRALTDVRWLSPDARRYWLRRARDEIRILEGWLNDEPRNPMAQHIRAEHLWFEGEQDEAIAVMRRLLRRKFDDSDRWFEGRIALRLGEFVADRGRRSQAKLLAVRALKSGIAADRARARMLLAELLSFEGDDEAVFALTGVVLLRGMGCRRTYEMAALHVGCACRLGRPADALPAMRRTVNVSEDTRITTLWRQLQMAVAGTSPVLGALGLVGALR